MDYDKLVSDLAEGVRERCIARYSELAARGDIPCAQVVILADIAANNFKADMHRRRSSCVAIRLND